MYDKILFLDIDGVLNSVNFTIRLESPWNRRDMDPETVKHLQRIVDETGCGIVISSTWRMLYDLGELKNMLIAAGMISCPVFDVTPRLGHSGRIRGEEIEKWFHQNDFLGFDANVTKYVCLDDDSDFIGYQPLVMVDNLIGLTSNHADKCIEILNKI